jgi:hypothetical protein
MSHVRRKKDDTRRIKQTSMADALSLSLGTEHNMHLNSAGTKEKGGKRKNCAPNLTIAALARLLIANYA